MFAQADVDIDFKIKIEEIQKRLRKYEIDGWLLFDQHGSNRFAHELLAIPKNRVLTRRFLYWIPAHGEPEKVVHAIEANSLDYLPGKKHLYLSWNELEGTIALLLKKAKTIAMEYSPRDHNPYVSVVDAGTMEVVHEAGVTVVSSADLLQHFTSVLNEKQVASHLDAAEILSKTVDRAWELIADRIRADKIITEYDVQQFILSEFMAHECITDDGPICAVNDNSALPHYVATREAARPIERGDYVLIDLWAKKDLTYAIYSDLTRVAVAAPQPTPRQQEIFEIVQQAQSQGIEFIRARLKSHKPITGAEVDDLCRNFIKEKGYGPNFTHRTGHNLDTNVHGAGVNLDNFETCDGRKILPNTALAIEPGIYLPGEFGLRLEYNLLIRDDSSIQITGGTEESIVCLL